MTRFSHLTFFLLQPGIPQSGKRVYRAGALEAAAAHQLLNNGFNMIIIAGIGVDVVADHRYIDEMVRI